MALILNIGAALANSGLNDAVSTPGGNGIAGAIDSGNATAVGNDMAQYITQAARATGRRRTPTTRPSSWPCRCGWGWRTPTPGSTRSPELAPPAPAATIGSGDATAIGNQSLTDVLQQAALNGSGARQLNVEQYATIMNIGFALANSGVNDITGVASAVCSPLATATTQNELAVDLFSMLLPALMQSFAGTSGSGTDRHR